MLSIFIKYTILGNRFSQSHSFVILLKVITIEYILVTENCHFINNKCRNLKLIHNQGIKNTVTSDTLKLHRIITNES